MKRNRRRGPLSAEEQKLVRENLGLVGLHLKRRLPHENGRSERAERPDLYQEGCLGLIQAAQDYDPASGIPFAAYALRRIHRAIGYATVRGFSLVRVPACELRRARRERRTRKDSRADESRVSDGRRACPSIDHRAVRLRAVVSGASIDHLHDLDCPASLAAGGLPTIEEHLRESYLRAVGHAARALASHRSRAPAGRCAQTGDNGHPAGAHRVCADKEAKVSELVRRSPRCRGAEWSAMIEAIVTERLMISSPAWQTPLRQLAERLGCGYPAVAACERRLLKEVERCLWRDEKLASLLRAAAKSPLGRRQPIDVDVERELREACATQFMRLLAEADDYARSEILRRLLDIAGEVLNPAICRTVSALPDDVRDQLLAQARASAAPRQKGGLHQLTRRCA